MIHTDFARAFSGIPAKVGNKLCEQDGSPQRPSDPHFTPTTTLGQIQRHSDRTTGANSHCSYNISLELAYCATPGNGPYETLAHRTYMLWFLFCSSFIIRVFLSHNVIWKQFLPTAGSAFRIGKHVKWKAVEDAETRQTSRLPARLARVLRLIWGPGTSLVRTQECLQTGNVHYIPFFRGSTCSLGEKFSECLADKIDQMQARSPAAKIGRLHVEASPTESSQHSLTSLRPASPGPLG